MSVVSRIPKGADEVVPEPSAGFVETPAIAGITERALTYLEVGYSVHFCGPAGTGKTTLAFHVAAQLARPVTLIHGDDEFGSHRRRGRTYIGNIRFLIDNILDLIALEIKQKTQSKKNESSKENQLTKT